MVKYQNDWTMRQADPNQEVISEWTDLRRLVRILKVGRRLEG